MRCVTICFFFLLILNGAICDSNYVNNIYVCPYTLPRSCYSRITMQSFLILDLPKMVQREIKLMYLPEWWELMVMQPQSMWWQVSMVKLFLWSFSALCHKFFPCILFLIWFCAATRLAFFVLDQILAGWSRNWPMIFSTNVTI